MLPNPDLITRYAMDEAEDRRRYAEEHNRGARAFSRGQGSLSASTVARAVGMVGVLSIGLLLLNL